MDITQSTVGNITIFSLAGPVDSTTSGQVQAALLAAIEAGTHRLTIDFGKVDYVSSAGLRVVLMTVKRARALGGDIAVFGLNNPVRETFEISGFNRILTIAGTGAEAAAAVACG